jgi:predicted acetylornithine/succinylornithine family transaminase
MQKLDSQTLRQMQDSYVLGTYSPVLTLVRGQGSWVWDVDDRKYLDLCVGISVCNLGHCHPRVTAAICEQAGRLVHVSNLFFNDRQPQLAALISEHSFGGRVFFCNSGAEANEGLIKLARRHGSAQGRYEIVCMQDSFHGRTLATLAATGRDKYRQGFAPDMPGFVHVPFNDLDAVTAAVHDRTAAVLLEPVQGEGGIIPADQAFLEGVRELCDRRGLLLLFDEVQCGMGRTGSMFAHQRYGVTPDAMAMAKALGNGTAIGAFTVTRELERTLPPGTHATTFGGNPLACAAGIAVFEAFEQESILDNVHRMAERLWAGLQGLQQKHPTIREIRGAGLMIGIDIGQPAAETIARAREAGLLILSAGETVVRLLPPLTVNAEEVDHALSILDRCLP